MFMSMNLCVQHLCVMHTKVVVAYTHILSSRLTHMFLALQLQNTFSCFICLCQFIFINKINFVNKLVYLVISEVPYLFEEAK